MTHLQKDFAIVYCIASIALIAIDAVLQIVAQVRLPDPGGVVALIPAVFYAGTRYAQQRDSIPESRQLWLLALELSLIALVLSLVIAGAMMVAFSGSESMSDFDVLFGAPVGLLLAGLIFAVFLDTLVIRFTLPMAIRSGLKARKR